MKKSIFLFLILFSFTSFSQIIVDRNTPNDNPTFLIDNVLLGGGIVASNHSYEGDSMQIGFFNAVNTSLGLDSGIVMATGDIDNLMPGTISFTNPANIVTDPDLLNVANSVPGMIGQSFIVSSINDVAKLEFDFIPTSDTITFRYVFGSQEYFAFENTQYNDVFGFFLSGPGISGPYANGSINLAIVPGSDPPLPITISSVNSVTPINVQYFVDNSGGLDTIADADGMTTVLTAVAVVQCGELYHIRLAIADGSDQGLSSYVWLEAGSFKSPELNVTDNFGFDSTYVEIPCNSTIILTADGGIGATYKWYDGIGTLLGNDSLISVGPGEYWVSATFSSCSINSDTITVTGGVPPLFDLGPDVIIPCSTKVTLTPLVTGGSGVYQYNWNISSSDSTSSSIFVPGGFYKLIIDDGTGCLSSDSITIIEDAPPITNVTGGGDICKDGSTTNVYFNFSGTEMPWNLEYTDGDTNMFQDGINSSVYILTTSDPGTYKAISVLDSNECISILQDSVIINSFDLPIAEISPKESTIYVGDVITLEVGDYISYEWYNNLDLIISENSKLDIFEAGEFYIIVVDTNNCSDTSGIAIVHTIPLTEIFVPTTFTPNGDFHNELFEVYGKNIISFNLKIINCWGDLLYQTDNINKFWDGKVNGNLVSIGSYYYSIILIGEDNLPYNKLGVIDVLY